MRFDWSVQFVHLIVLVEERAPGVLAEVIGKE